MRMYFRGSNQISIEFATNWRNKLPYDNFVWKAGDVDNLRLASRINTHYSEGCFLVSALLNSPLYNNRVVGWSLCAARGQNPSVSRLHLPIIEVFTLVTLCGTASHSIMCALRALSALHTFRRHSSTPLYTYRISIWISIHYYTRVICIHLSLLSTHNRPHTGLSFDHVTSWDLITHGKFFIRAFSLIYGIIVLLYFF